MYTAVLEGAKIVARDCEDRTLSYTCPDCGMPVILKKGKVKTPHFAHKDNFLSCDFGANESESHIKAKDWLYQFYNNNGHKAEPEFKFKWDDNVSVIADIKAEINSKSENTVAVEVLTQGLTVGDIMGRMQIYREHNIPVLYILDESFYRKTLKAEFKLTAPMQYLYRYYYNNLFVFSGKEILVYKVSNAVHTKPEWYDQYGDYHEPSQYTCKTIYVTDKVKSVDLVKDFTRKKKDKYYGYPAGYIYTLKYEIASNI